MGWIGTGPTPAKRVHLDHIPCVSVTCWAPSHDTCTADCRPVAHPRMYRDDDPGLPELRTVCLALPESAEVEAWGRPTFRAGKKMFAVFEGNDEHPYAVTFKPEPDERPALLEDSRFYVPSYFGPGGWVALDLIAAPVDWDEVAELMETSYRQVALKHI